MIDPASFSLALFRYHLLPYFAVNIASLWLPGLELVCALALLVPRLRASALILIFILLILFSLGISVNLLQGSQMACGCFSTSPMAHSNDWSGVAKNSGLMILIACILSLTPREKDWKED